MKILIIAFVVFLSLSAEARKCYPVDDEPVETTEEPVETTETPEETTPDETTPDETTPVETSTTPRPLCPEFEVYLENGPGPFCYPTCCGPRGPPCRLNSFTAGCFCENPNDIKMFPVRNNTVETNNMCVSDCSKYNCAQISCAMEENTEWRTCGPTWNCDEQVCRGARPQCSDEDAAVCVEGCFCAPGYFKDGSKCVKDCPLYPSAPGGR